MLYVVYHVCIITRLSTNECLDELVERGEKLDLLVDKTDNLTAAAVTFKTSGRNLHRQMW